MQGKKVGIVGGLGYMSTLEYYRGIMKECQTYTNSGEYPELVIASLNIADVMRMLEKGFYEQVTWYLYRAIQDLRKARADFAVIASNTPHIVFNQLSEISPLPLISIMDVTSQAISRCGYSNVLLTGTAFTMKNRFYKDNLESHGIKCTVPNAEDIETIHNIIFPDLENGIVKPEKKREFITLCEKYVPKGIQAIILGCTELPLLINDGDMQVPIIDTMKLHISAIVDEIYGIGGK
jgi:aspartate racemase